GKPVTSGSHDPLEDVSFLESELETWMYQILSKEWDKITRKGNLTAEELAQSIAERLSGLGLRKFQVEEGLKQAGLNEKPAQWSREDTMRLVGLLRRESKPMMLAAEKMQRPTRKDNVP